MIETAHFQTIYRAFAKKNKLIVETKLSATLKLGEAIMRIRGENENQKPTIKYY